MFRLPRISKASFETKLIKIPSPKLHSISQGTPNEYALANTLKAAPLAFIHGRQIHAVIVKLGFCRFTVLMTALMNFNFKCGYLEEAIKVFDEMSERDVISWTSVIVAYAKRQHYKDSLDSFRRMIVSGILPNGFSFSGALSACSGLEALRQGQQIHCHVLTSGALGADGAVVQNSLLHMYWRCHCVLHAHNLFNSITSKGSIAWNEMISGYLQCGQREEALKLFASMAVKPDNFSYAICADACGSLASMQQGSQIHACVLKTGFQSDLIITNALVDMYAKCGCVDSAKLVFDSRPSRDALLWTTMMSAFGRNGKVKEVVEMFEQMRAMNIQPDEITFLVVLSACSHGGLVKEGCDYFQLMTAPASQEHYASIVDLLSRSGNLTQAMRFIEQMPLKPGISVWSTFLSCCRVHGNLELAQIAGEHILELDPKNLVPLSNVYASEGDWNETEEMRELMKSKNVKKEPGCSWIELKTGVHVFLTRSISHPEVNEILLTLSNTCWKDGCVG